MTLARQYRYWGARVLAAVVVFSLVAGIACGQSSGDNSRTIVEEYFKTARAADWKGCALTVHPSELGKFKGTLVPLLTNIKDAGNPADPLLPFFEGAKDWDAIFAKDSTEFFSGTMSWITSLAPQMGMMIAGTEVQIVGSLDEGKDTKHYVYHMKLQPTDTETSTEVISVRDSNGRWMVVLGGTIGKLASLFRRA